MAKFAALPLFTDALLADTGHLSHDEFGMYMRLLIITWRTPECVIPNDPSWIAKRLNVSPLEYASKIKPLILEFFVPCEGDAKLMQKRLRKEYDYVINKSEAGRVAAEKRWEKERDIENKGKAPMRTGCETDAPTPTPTPTPTPSLSKSAREGEEDRFDRSATRPEGAFAFEPPDWLPLMEWSAWIQYLAGRGKPIQSAYQMSRHVGSLSRLRDEGHDPREMIGLAIEKGWNALYEPRKGDMVGKKPVEPTVPRKVRLGVTEILARKRIKMARMKTIHAIPKAARSEREVRFAEAYKARYPNG